jgi:hypothetical protein
MNRKKGVILMQQATENSEGNTELNRSTALI